MMTKKFEVDQAKLDRLEELEEIVETVQDPMGKGLAALTEILREELYRLKGYKTEDEYLEKRWNRFAGRTLYHKQAVLRVAKNVGDALPEGTREAHLAVLVNYEETIQVQAIELAHQQCPPGKKPTAGMIEQIARRLEDARLAKVKEEAERERFRKAEAAAQAAEEDEEEEEIEEEQEAETEEEEDEDEALPPPPAPSRGGRPSATARALTNPIVREEDLRNAKAQAGRATRKCCRIHQRLIDLGDMDASSTIADFFEKYGPK